MATEEGARAVPGLQEALREQWAVLAAIKDPLQAQQSVGHGPSPKPASSKQVARKQPQAKECGRPQKLKKIRKGFSPEPSK